MQRMVTGEPSSGFRDFTAADAVAWFVGMSIPGGTLFLGCLLQAREDVFLFGSLALVLGAVWTLRRKPRSRWLRIASRGLLWGWVALFVGFWLLVGLLWLAAATGLLKF